MIVGYAGHVPRARDKVGGSPLGHLPLHLRLRRACTSTSALHLLAQELPPFRRCVA